jgi:Fe-S cluster biosynthesis and repair protein YggX
MTLTSELTKEEKLTLSKWVKYVCFRGNVPENFDKIFYELIQKGDISAMTHAFTVMFEEHDKELMEQTERKAMQRMARALLNEGMKAEKVAEISGLMIDDVLRLM